MTKHNRCPYSGMNFCKLCALRVGFGLFVCLPLRENEYSLVVISLLYSWQLLNINITASKVFAFDKVHWLLK